MGSEYFFVDLDLSFSYKVTIRMRSVIPLWHLRNVKLHCSRTPPLRAPGDFSCLPYRLLALGQCEQLLLHKSRRTLYRSCKGGEKKSSEGRFHISDLPDHCNSQESSHAAARLWCSVKLNLSLSCTAWEKISKGAKQCRYQPRR